MFFIFLFLNREIYKGGIIKKKISKPQKNIKNFGVRASLKKSSEIMNDSQADDLFDLIKSMSRTEKRYFKLDAQKAGGKKSNSYLKLFDALKDLEEYDEPRIFKKLKGEPLLNRLSTEKNYLYYAILKSMRSYWSEKSAYSRIKDMILNAHYLLDRGLYEQCEKMLNKAKKLAEQYKESTSLLEINKLERTVYINLRVKSLKAKLEELVKEKDEALDLLAQELEYADYKYLIFSEYIKQKRLTDPDEIQKFKINFPLEEVNEGNIGLVHPLYEYYQSQFYYYRILGEYKKLFEITLKIIEWWEIQKEFKKEYFFKYIGDLMNYVSIAYLNKRLDLIPSILDKIENEPPNSFHEERLVFETLALSKMLYFLNDGQFEAARKFVGEIESKFKKYYIKPALKTSIFGNFAVLFFLLNEFKTSIKWIDEIIEYKKNQHRQDIQRYIRVLKIIGLLELGLVDEFDNTCRSAIRYIEATTSGKNKVFEYEVIKRLKKISSMPLDSLMNEYDDFKQFLEDKKNNPHDQISHGLEEYLFWVNSKIANSTILEWIRNQ